MPQFNIDFSEAVEFKPVGTGWYVVEVEAVEIRQSKKGDSMLGVQLGVVEGISETCEFSDGQKIFANWMLQGRGAGITKAAFNAFLGSAEEGTHSTEELEGARAEVYVTKEVWAEEDGGDGRVRNRITRYRELSEPPF